MCDLLLGRVEGDLPLDTRHLFNGTIHITRQSFPILAEGILNSGSSGKIITHNSRLRLN